MRRKKSRYCCGLHCTRNRTEKVASLNYAKFSTICTSCKISFLLLLLLLLCYALTNYLTPVQFRIMMRRKKTRKKRRRRKMMMRRTTKGRWERKERRVMREAEMGTRLTEERIQRFVKPVMHNFHPVLNP